MKKGSTIFLQAIIVALGLVVLGIMIRFPLTEGRAVNLDLFSIYSDPFIMYGYAASIPFFVALYQAFRLLRYVRQNKVFSLSSVKALRTIKYCAITLSFLIVMAAIYIRISYGISPAQNDDPAGFIAIAILATFISIVIATAASVFERILRNAIDIKSKNNLIA